MVCGMWLAEELTHMWYAWELCGVSGMSSMMRNISECGMSLSIVTLFHIYHHISLDAVPRVMICGMKVGEGLISMWYAWEACGISGMRGMRRDMRSDKMTPWLVITPSRIYLHISLTLASRLWYAVCGQMKGCSACGMSKVAQTDHRCNTDKINVIMAERIDVTRGEKTDMAQTEERPIADLRPIRHVMDTPQTEK